MYKALVFCIVLFALLVTASPALLQGETPLECNQVYPAELLSASMPDRFLLPVSAGTILNIRIEPIGNSFNPHISLIDSQGNPILFQNSTIEGQAEVLSDYVVSSSNPTLEIRGDALGRTYGNRLGPSTSLGAYTIHFNCGDDPTPAPPPPVSFEIGTPVIPSQDFSIGVVLPLQPVVSNPGNISPGFQGIFGYTFDADAGDIVNLTFTRQSGNLSLGLSVIAQDNTLAFQTTLAGASNLTVTFPVTATGTYTIGVFISNISAPAAPENTSFTIQASLSS